MKTAEATAREADTILLGGNYAPALEWLTSEDVGLDFPQLWLDSVSDPQSVPEELRWPGRRYHLAYTTGGCAPDPEIANSSQW